MIINNTFLWIYNKNIQIDNFDLPAKEITFFLISLLFVVTNFVFLSIGFLINSDYLLYDSFISGILAIALILFRVPYSLGMLNYFNNTTLSKEKNYNQTFEFDYLQAKKVKNYENIRNKIFSSHQQQEFKSETKESKPNIPLKSIVINPKNRHLYTLGLKDNATFDDIKIAYRRLSMKYHPDRNLNKNTTERFKIIKNSYEELKIIFEM